ncbi:hypothetical protein [uncultured Gammaproteobacteria bacterium]|jgi:hypothetical protein|nr:hypothetical protein [uncultured Gammaproteobacteria bacterium]CAC9612796.1 hypothetical protein [uncultured Gammaproteobacteria bacterium]
MKKILIISLFLFGQQAFSEVIPSDQLTGIYKNQGKTNTYIDNKIENKLDSVNNILCYLHSLRSEEFVNQGNYEAWMSFKLCNKKSNNLSIFKTVVNVSKTGDKQVVKAKASVSSNNIKVRLNMEIRASATKANPLGDLTLNWKSTNDEVEYAINGVLEISNGKIQVVSYEDDQLLDFFVSDVAKKQGSFLMNDMQRTFAFNDDFIKTTTTCFDRSQPTSTVWGYHVYAYIPGATPNTVKLDLNGILPFAFSYKDDEDNVKHGYVNYHYTYLSGNRPDTIVSTSGDNKGTTYTVTYANNYIDKLTTVNGTEQGIAKPIEFDKSAITATDIRSNVAPTSAIYFNSEFINLLKIAEEGEVEILSLKDGVVLIGKDDNKKYIVKAEDVTVAYKVTDFSNCNDLVLPTYTPPSITPSAIDVDNVSDSNIDKVSVIDGVIQ